jgi:hypothetical protein
MPVLIRSTIGQRSIALCLALGMLSAGAFAAPSSGREFSADIVSRDAAGLTVGTTARLYVSNHKVRIETPEASTGFFLFDGDAGTTLFVRPNQRVFMDAKQSSRLAQIFVPIDSRDPCRQWQTVAGSAGAGGVAGAVGNWRCERIDDSIANDRRAVEYRVTSPAGASSLRWIDSDLAFPVKLLMPDGATIALERIRFEAQPASLFTIPPEYRKFDPQALIERIKHSDAWVDP